MPRLGLVRSSSVRLGSARLGMGIDWMTKAELNEAIPPAYTEFIGAQLLSHISQTEMAAASGL